jgi:hypothetical protein
LYFYEGKTSNGSISIYIERRQLDKYVNRLIKVKISLKTRLKDGLLYRSLSTLNKIIWIIYLPF